MRETQENKISRKDLKPFDSGYPPERRLEIDINISLINFIKHSILITKIGIKRIYRSDHS